MKIQQVTISLAELQDALREYCEKHAVSQVELVRVESHGKEVIAIDLHPGAFVEAVAFKHRAG